MIKFEVHKFSKGQFYFELHLQNGQVIQSETYTRKQGCIKGIKALRRNIFCAKVEDLTDI
jgi:uncharacterized protein YegP (UPF0339 family)